jgi:hypothetical protein
MRLIFVVCFVVFSTVSCALRAATDETGRSHQSSPLTPELIANCRALVGRYSAVGLDASSGTSVRYYEAARLRNPNNAQTLRIDIDSTSNRPVLRQQGSDGRDVVAYAPLRGDCRNGVWVYRWQGDISSEGTRYKLNGEVSLEAVPRGLRYRHFADESSRGGIVRDSADVIFERLQ